MKNETQTPWQRAPVCFACGKEIGSNPDDVLYVGYGRRRADDGPGWVASVCSCEIAGTDPGAPSPCAEVAQAFADEDGTPLSLEQYQRWLTGA